MKIKRFLFILMILCLIGTAGTWFYRKNRAPSPEEVTRVQLDAIFREGDKDLAALFMDKIQKTQLACALAGPAEHEETFFENILTGLQKINYKVAECTQSGGEAEVSVDIDCFDLQKIMENAQKKLGEEMEILSSLSTEERVEKHYEVFAGEFQKGPSDDSKTRVTVALHKKKDQWEMDDAFGDEIISAILKIC